MKTAVVFDGIINRGGSERVMLVLARAFKADIWTTDFTPARTYPEFSRFQVYPHPLWSRRYSPNLGPFNFLQRALVEAESDFKFRRLDLSEYDLVITVGHYCKLIPLTGKKRIHYELWVVNRHKYQWVCKPWVDYINRLDFRATRAMPCLISNSEHIRRKVRDYYGRDCRVVYSATEIGKFKTGESGDYFIAVERITPDKAIETQIEAFRLTPQRQLVIVGTSTDKDRPYFEKLKKNAPPNVKFSGRVTDQELVDLYSHALAAIQTHPDEDLGLVPIEAMASGKPSLAVNAGGFRETILNGVTGVLVDPPYVENLARAVREFNPRDYREEDCLARSRLFSEETFIREMQEIAAGL